MRLEDPSSTPLGPEPARTLGARRSHGQEPVRYGQARAEAEAANHASARDWIDGSQLGTQHAGCHLVDIDIAIMVWLRHT